MKIFTEKKAEDFLEKNKFKIVQRKLISKKSQLKNLKIDFPIVMKISSKTIIHKHKTKGIILNIKDQEQAEKAYNRLKKKTKQVLIQKQTKGQELILGIKQTPEFGHVIMLGNKNDKKDNCFRVLPINKKDAEDMIKDIKIKINHPDKVRNNLLKLSKLVMKNKKIKELDISPLINGLIVDAQIIFS